jgi:hypothetical protein
VSFAWSPFVHNVTAEVARRLGGDGGQVATPDVVLLSAGLWNVLHDPPQEPAARGQYLAAMGRELAAHLLRHEWRLHPDVRRQRLQGGVAIGAAAAASRAADPDLHALTHSAVPGKGYHDWQPAA